MHAAGDRIADRYVVELELGRGGGAVTWACRDTHSGEAVAVKGMALRGLESWKALELFEREARVLGSLDHPGIPRYVDHFSVDGPSGQRLYLVQALAPGRSLAERLRTGFRTDEAGVRRIAHALLDILGYLHARKPPVLHRDLKPANVILDEAQRVWLVDFGSVRDALRAPGELGSTTVGTYGYMAPEQLHGAASPASDLYGLGATLVTLLSGRSPSELPHQRLKLDLSMVPCSPELRAWLAQLLEPAAEDRYTTVEEARAGFADPPGERPLLHGRALVAVAAAAILAVGGIAVTMRLSPSRPAELGPSFGPVPLLPPIAAASRRPPPSRPGRQIELPPTGPLGEPKAATEADRLALEARAIVEAWDGEPGWLDVAKQRLAQADARAPTAVLPMLVHAHLAQVELAAQGTPTPRDLAPAHGWIDRALARDRKQPEAEVRRAWLHFLSGEVRRARVALQRAQPLPPRGRLLEARLSLSEGRTAEAEAQALAVVRAGGERFVVALAFDVLAEIFASQRMTEATLAALRRRVEVTPDSPAAQRALATFLLSTSDLPGALAAAEQARKLRDDAPSRRMLARVLLTDGAWKLWRDERPAEARDKLAAAVAADPTFAEAQYALGAALRALAFKEHSAQPLEAARQAFERAIALDPQLRTAQSALEEHHAALAAVAREARR